MDYWHDDATLHPPVGTWMRHVHHETLCEPLTEPLANRLDYIRTHKPTAEQDTRLRLISPVRGTLPAALVKARTALNEARTAFNEARTAFDEARTALNEARTAFNEAWTAFDEARTAAQPELEALHAAECPNCPWNGHTIFPEASRGRIRHRRGVPLIRLYPR